MWKVLSEPSADVWSAIQQSIVVEKLSKLDVEKKIKEWNLNPNDYYFGRVVGNL